MPEINPDIVATDEEVERVAFDRRLAALCDENWRFHAGEPPEYDSPLSQVYDAGIGYAWDQLAGLLGVTNYEGGDGSEDYAMDVANTGRNILVAAGFVDADGDLLTAAAIAAMRPASSVEGELVGALEGLISYADAEKRGYGKGYAAGRRRALADDRLERLAAMRENFRQQVFLAIVGKVFDAQGWSFGDKPITSTNDRLRLAWSWADKATERAIFIVPALAAAGGQG